MLMLRSPDIRAMLPADGLPHVVALGEDSLAYVCSRVAPGTKGARVVVVLGSRLAVIQVDATLSGSTPSGDRRADDAFHPDAPLGLLLEYMVASNRRTIEFGLSQGGTSVHLLQEPLAELPV